jgi:putative thioredoxin
MVNSQIIHVNDTNFQIEVLSFSQNTPVVVEFWATWCRDCRTFYPELDEIILNSYTNIRLAKINVDENPNTTLRYSVRSLPSVKAFSYARIIDQITGYVPEQRVHEMLMKVNKAGQNTLSLEKAINLYEDQYYSRAETEFRHCLENNPETEEALFGLVKTLLAQHKFDEAQPLLENFPSSKLSEKASQLLKFTKLMREYRSEALPNQSPLDATFLTSLRLIQLENYEAALDGLLDILKQDKNYRNNTAKTVFLSLLEVLPESSLDSRKYRLELSSVLF